MKRLPQKRSPHYRVSQPSTSRGFTLIELLTVIAFIAILGSILLVGIGKVRERAVSIESVSNLREIHSAISMYVMNNNGEYPRARTLVPTGGSGSVWNYESGFWFNAIGEYLDEGRRFRQDLVATGPWPQSTPFASPSITDKSLHGWGGAGIDVGLNGYLFPAGRPPTPRVRDLNIENPARALLAADAADPSTGIGSWQTGHPGAFSGANIAFRHGGKANLLFVDGSVRQITPDQLEDEDFVESLAGK